MLCILTLLQKKRRTETKELCWEMDVDLIVGILSQWVCTSNHHITHFKYTTVVFIDYTSIKPENVFKN